MLTDINILHKRPEGMDYEIYREERRSCNKTIKSYLRGIRDVQQGKSATRFNTIRQVDKYLTQGWSELAPNEKKFFELLEQIRENERQQNTHRDDISQRGVGSEPLPASDAQPVVD
jgi:hypothetical protein